ncbi:MAG TPA: hypothetical protein DCL42_04350 [Deltaproteobacteria bacterium]|nr:hypothetical protein [Deltaproteobacteria bacterium]
MLVHNHPDALPEPSECDNMLTTAVKKALKTVDISLQGACDNNLMTVFLVIEKADILI